MKLGDLMQRVQELRNPLERPPGLDPLDTRNKRLDSLRRLRKAQLEEVEEKQLRQDISSYNKAKTTRTVFGDTPLRNHSFKTKKSVNHRRGMFAGRGTL